MKSHLKILLLILSAVQSLCAMELFDATQGIQQTINPALLHSFWMFNEQEVLPPLEPEVEPLVVPSPEELKRSRRERKPTVLYKDFITDKLEKDSVDESDDNTIVLDNYNSKKRTKISATKQFACDLCQKSYDNEYHLNRHTRTAHSDNRPFGCHLCPKSFKEKHHMVEHERRHGSYTVACPVCTKCLKRNEEVTRHLKDVHRIQIQYGNEHVQ